MLDRQHFHAARRFANATPAHVRVVAVEQPQFRDERGFHDSPMENPDHAALGHDNRNGADTPRNRGGREMAASETQRQIDRILRHDRARADRAFDEARTTPSLVERGTLSRANQLLLIFGLGVDLDPARFDAFLERERQAQHAVTMGSGQFVEIEEVRNRERLLVPR